MENTTDIDVSESHISSNRIWQIRNILINTTQDQIDTILANVSDNRKAVIYNVQKHNKSKNINQIKYLNEYINNYIASLNSYDILELTQVIEYYENIFEIYSYDSEEDILSFLDNYKLPVGQRMERLFKLWSLLPNNRKKSEFIKEMNSLMVRLRNYVENQAKKSGFSITYLSPDVLLDFIRNDSYNNWVESWNYELTFWTETRDSYLKSVKFTLSLPELYESEEWFQKENELGNTVKFELIFTKNWEVWVNKEEFLSFLEDRWFDKDRNTYVLWWNDHVKIKLIPYNKVIDSDWNERFYVEIYSQVQKTNISSEQFVELSIAEISYKTEKLVNDIYNFFWNPSMRFTFDMEMLMDDMEILDEEESDIRWLKIKDSIYWNDNNKSRDARNTISTKEINVSSEIILKDNEMEILETIIDEINHPEDYINSWIKPTKWVVLHWPAGTGKTLFAEHVSKKIDAEFMVVKPAEIMSEYISVWERNLQKKFEEARKLSEKWNKKRVVMFFDEADSFFEKSWSQDNHKWWMINIFLSATDWIDKWYLDNIIIIFTTNRLQVIPEAVLDRLNLKLKIDLPDKEQRVKHFKLNIDNINNKATNNNFSEIDYELLANKTEWKSWRFINRLIENAVRHFVRTKRNQEIEKEIFITTEDITQRIKDVEALENSSKWIWFHANIK